MIVNLKSDKKELRKGLYLVSTPIGNLKDITLRAIETLQQSEYVLCEDTRISKKLFEKYKIKSKLISNHKFNEKKNLSKIIEILKGGSIVSLISDAGTPSISDPGRIITKECIKNNIEVIPLPGPSAISSAVSISGFSDKFFFYGFFPEKIQKLQEDLENLSKFNYSIIFFISSKKINRAIPILKKYFTGRKTLICREISKFYEEYIRSDIDKLELFDNNLKGELTVVISEKKDEKDLHLLSESDKRIISSMINKLSIKEISNLINQNNKISKKTIYDYCLKIKNKK